ncbi:hypothetical protein D3C87_1414940 [compost metagenome]
MHVDVRVAAQRNLHISLAKLRARALHEAGHARRDVRVDEHVGQAGEPHIAVEPARIPEERFAEHAQGRQELILGVATRLGQAIGRHVFRFDDRNDHAHTLLPLLDVEGEDVGDAALRLREPASVVIEQEVGRQNLASARGGTEFLGEQMPAEHQADHFARGDAALGRAQHDVARDRERIALGLVGCGLDLGGVELQIELIQAAAHQHAQQPKLGGRAHDHVAAVGGAAAVADDGDVVVLELTLVEQLVVGGDPLGQVVGVFDHAG